MTESYLTGSEASCTVSKQSPSSPTCHMTTYYFGRLLLRLMLWGQHSFKFDSRDEIHF